MSTSAGSAPSHVGYIGTLHTFAPSVNKWAIAKPRMNSFFVSNAMRDDTLKASLFINSLDEEGYQLLANLSVPKTPEDKTFNELISLFDKHFLPQESVFSCRYKFVNAAKEQNETLNEWLARLRSLAATCMYSDLDDRVLDQFVFGLPKGPVRDRLFEEDRVQLKLEKALKLATSREAALHQYDLSNAATVKTEPVYRTVNFNKFKKGTSDGRNVTKQQQKTKGSIQPCSICGNRHRAVCFFKDARCENCSKNHLTKETVERKLREEIEGNVECKWKYLRPHLNWDFVDQRHYPYLGGPRVHVEPLAQQERQLVEDLLNSFLGFTGYYIEPTSLTDPKGERSFNISPQVSSQLKTLAEKILPLSSNYSKIVRFIQDNHNLNAGRVNQALSDYLDSQMQEFCQMVSVIEDRLVTGSITLSTMWSDLQGYMTKLEVLHQIVRCVWDTRGGLTLTALHENITLTMADQNAQHIFCEAAKAASVPFFESLAKWIYTGIVFDPFDEFMIIEKTRKRNPNNWDNIFTVDFNYVPSFLHKVVEYIHRSGKYLDAIRNSLSFLEVMPTAEQKLITYDFFDPSYLDNIRQAYEFANFQLLHLLVIDRDIIGRLRTAKAFFSLEHGDLFNNIIENCMVELRKPVSEVCQSYLPSLVVSAIKGSSMKSLKYSSEVTVHLEKRSLLNQTLNLANPLSSTRLQDDEQCGIDALILKTINKWPDCIIMHEKAVKCYQMLFRHLFYVKWVHLKVSQTHLMPLTMNQSILKHCTLTFISSCLSYMTQGTIERNWVEFHSKASQANTVEELRSYHDDFLYKSLSNCMLTSADLYTKFRKTLDICLVFAEDQSENHALPFTEAVMELVSAANKANMTGIEGFIALVQPTYDYTLSSSMSSMCSYTDDLTEEISTN